jgi:aldehyde dehydrogenase (NAD+)
MINSQNNQKFYINGQWCSPISSQVLDVINPANEEIVSQITLGNEQDLNNAVEAAKNSFDSWSVSSVDERLKLLNKLRDIYQKRFDEMTIAITTEMGCPKDFSSNAQTQSGLDHLNDFIEQLKNFKFENKFNEKSNNYIVHEPIGVCGLITPWNWPINQIALKVIPALATGCTMVLKPSEIAPLSAILFAEMIDEAGFPAGVFNLVNGDGAGVGSFMSGHPDIDLISFTGSTRAGRLILEKASHTIKRVCLELGGKGGNIVFADAPLNAVRDGIRNVMSNSGQSCDAPTRMLVERSIYDRAVEEAVDEVSKIKVDSPEKSGDHIGPVVSKVQYDKIINLIELGKKEGANLACGGSDRPKDLNKGYYIQPTIFTMLQIIWKLLNQKFLAPSYL